MNTWKAKCLKKKTQKLYEETGFIIKTPITPVRPTHKKTIKKTR